VLAGVASDGGVEPFDWLARAFDGQIVPLSELFLSDNGFLEPTVQLVLMVDGVISNPISFSWKAASTPAAWCGFAV